MAGSADAGLRPVYVYAAPREIGPWGGDARAWGVGVGKVAAAVTLSRRVVEHRPSAVVAVGVAGSYSSGLAVGQACLVEHEWLADEGVHTPEGFVPIESLGLGRRGPWSADAALLQWLDAQLGEALPRVVGATVSTCSGTDALARTRMQACPGVAIETMEGAAMAAVCHAAAIPFAQLRVVSNRTGDRDRAGWDLDGALARLHERLARLLGPAPG